MLRNDLTYWTWLSGSISGMEHPGLFIKLEHKAARLLFLILSNYVYTNKGIQRDEDAGGYWY
jgi:hypothetical protein